MHGGPHFNAGRSIEVHFRVGPIVDPHMKSTRTEFGAVGSSRRSVKQAKLQICLSAPKQEHLLLDIVLTVGLYSVAVVGLAVATVSLLLG